MSASKNERVSTSKNVRKYKKKTMKKYIWQLLVDNAGHDCETFFLLRVGSTVPESLEFCIIYAGADCRIKEL